MSHGTRISALDLARTAAIAGMIAFHFCYDLELFGYLPRGTTTSGFFWYHARIVAGTFLFLAGISLWLSHGQGVRWRAFLRRLAMIVAAALLVSVISRFATPAAPIHFGILHCIAAASLIGLAALRLPAALTLGLALLAFIAPSLAISPRFDGMVWIWTGLAQTRPLMADYVPLLPWLAPFLAGLSLCRMADRAGVLALLSASGGQLPRFLVWPGQHSLIIYLVHQPVMIAGFVAFHWLTSP